MKNEISLWKRLVYIAVTALIFFFAGYLIFVGVKG